MPSGTWAQEVDYRFEYTLGENWGRGWGRTPGPYLSTGKESELGARARGKVRGGSLWATGAGK